MAELISRRYAVALFELCKEENTLDSVHDEFSAINQVISKERELSEFMLSPQFRHEEKKAMLKQIFEGKISDTLTNFFCLVSDKSRFDMIDGIYDYFHTLYFEERGIVSAVAYSVVPMKPEVLEQLKMNLEKQFNKKIVIENQMDSELIGGVKLRIGDKVIDGSIKRRMELLKDNLLEHRV